MDCTTDLAWQYLPAPKFKSTECPISNSPMSKSDLSLLANHILSIFKCSLYEARGRNITPDIHFIKARIMQTKRIEFFLLQSKIINLIFTTKNGIELDHFYISHDK